MSYNIGVKYLIEKYPSGHLQKYTPSFEERLRKARNKKEYKEIEASATDNDTIKYMQNLRNIENVDHDDLEVYLLLDQYYSGITVKKELETKLIRMGLVISN